MTTLCCLFYSYIQDEFHIFPLKNKHDRQSMSDTYPLLVVLDIKNNMRTVLLFMVPFNFVGHQRAMQLVLQPTKNSSQEL